MNLFKNITKHQKFKLITTVLIYLLPVLFFYLVTGQEWHAGVIYHSNVNKITPEIVHITIVAYAMMFAEILLIAIISAYRIHIGLKYKKIDILGSLFLVLMLVKLCTFDYTVFQYTELTLTVFEKIVFNQIFNNISLITVIIAIIYPIIYLLTRKIESSLYIKIFYRKK